MNSVVHQRLSVETELSNLATELLETFSALETGSEPRLDSSQLLRKYIRAVTRCGLAAGRSGAAQLQDHCVKFQGILRSLLAQPAEVVSQYLQVLEQWPLLLMSQINNGDDDSFLQEVDALVHSTNWPQTAAPDPVSQAAVPESPPAPPDCETPEQSDTELPLIEPHIAHRDLLAELEAALQPVQALAPSTEAGERLQVFQDCADQMELFAVSAASAGLLGLMDIAQLFQASLRVRATSLTPESPAWQSMLKLHTAMAEYVRSPATTSLGIYMLDTLQDFLEPDQLDTDVLAALSQLLMEPDDTAVEATEPAQEIPTEMAPDAELQTVTPNPATDELAAVEVTEPAQEIPTELAPDAELHTVAPGPATDKLAAVEVTEPAQEIPTELAPDAELHTVAPGPTTDELATVEATEPAQEIPTELAPDAELHTVAPNPATDEVAASDVPDLSAQALELLQLITAEFEPLSGDFAVQLQILLDPATSPAQKQTAADQYTAALHRFTEVFESIGLLGLYQLFASVAEFIQTHAQSLHEDCEHQFWLVEWPAHILNYLSDPASHVEALVQHCQADGTPLHADSLEELFSALRSPHIDTGEEETVPRQTVAEAEDVTLQVPDDVNPQLLESLLQELPQQTAEFSRVIGNIIQGQGTLQDVETAQRLAHTLKGSANTVGVAGIANLTHHLEDILLAFTRDKVLPVSPLTATLQDAADVLEMMSEALLGMGPAPQQQALAVLQQILDWANQIDLNGLPEMSTPLEGEQAAQTETETNTTNTTTANADNSLRISTQSVDDTLRLIGEATIVNAQLQESLRRSLAHNKAIHSQSTQFQQLAFELEQLIDVRGMHGLLSGINHSDFDALEMDQYNELHTLTRRLVEAATDTRTLTQYAEDELKQLDGLLHQQMRHTKDTQEVVMKTRMLPVQTIVPRLQRSVRQTCRLTGKQAELAINGTNTLLDNDILARLADPLMHILRNAVDHGIESPEQRELTGKPPGGRISLDFSREGEHILIRCKDDGAGLDYDAIKRVALDKGLVQQDETLSTEILTRLIFVSGLSTREETTQMSGRGIGMDAVYNQISNMKGVIRVSSEPRDGVLVEIQLPATLVTLHGILVRVHKQVIAIANRGVEQILYADDGNLYETEDHGLTYQYQDENYRAIFLEDLLGLERPAYTLDEIRRPAMMLNTADGSTVTILIEQILTTQDVVVKKLGPYVPALKGVEGVTILGDGSVATVMDLGAVFADIQGSDVLPHIESDDSAALQAGAPMVLVVDDSLSARNSLAEFMRDSGFRVCTARDGMDAITQLEDESPDILLVDMEMPRMNGLELSAYVRANTSTQNLPIIMITSRATDKHRNEARKAGVNAYLTKPYSESEVLDQISAQLNNAYTPLSH